MSGAQPEEPMRFGASAYPVYLDDGWVVFEPASSAEGDALGWVRVELDGTEHYLMLSIDADEGAVVFTHNGVEIKRWLP